MRANKKIFLVILLLQSAILTANDNVAEYAAREYILDFKFRKFNKAAEHLHCPKNYKAEKYVSEINSISENLKIFYEEFGSFSDAKLVSNASYITVAIGCGNISFWHNHPPVKQLIYETTHQNNSKGYIVFSFSIIDSEYVLAFVNHGISRTRKNADIKIRHVLKRISDSKK